jgi:hypothetical protein
MSTTEPLVLSYALGDHSKHVVKKDICSLKCARLALIAFTNTLKSGD